MDVGTTGMDDRNTKSIITLVHGTWARGMCKRDTPTAEPRWFEGGSSFRTVLAKEWENKFGEAPVIRVVLWSGDNSIKERDRAGALLAEEIRSQKNFSHKIRQLVIAHSHGGNVALRAVDHLRNDADGLFVATMGTPFVETFENEAHARPTSFWTLLVLSPVAVFVGYLLEAAWPITFLKVLKYLIAIPAIVAISSLFLPYVWKRRLTGKAFEAQAAKLTSHKSFKASGAKLLVVRAVDDEAGLAISIGGVIRFISRFSARIIERGGVSKRISLGYTGCIAVILLTCSYLIDHSFMIPVDAIILNGPPIWNFVCYALLFLPLVFWWLCLIVRYLSHGVYGREFLLHFFEAEVNINSVPDSDKGVSVHTVKRGNTNEQGNVRHALYDQAESVEAIVRWALLGK